MKKYSNMQLDAWMTALSNCIDAVGTVGFAVAHNYRVIREAIQEYTKKKEEAIAKYGIQQPSGEYIIQDEEKLNTANAELLKYATLEVAVDIMEVDESCFETAGLTGRQIISIEFMIKKPEALNGDVIDDKDDDDRFGI